MPAEPSPYPARTFPDAQYYLYVDGIDLTPWADRNQLQQAALQYGQGLTETMTVTLQHVTQNVDLFPTYPPQYLPAIRAGQVPVLYVHRYGTAPGDYYTLFGGVVQHDGMGDASWAGSTTLTIATPNKMLRTQLGFVRFYPNIESNDVLRLRSLGHKWGHPDWNFSIPSALPSISYPLPNYTIASGEPVTDYTDRTVYDIIMDITSDPGMSTDTGYPVPNRPWWIEPLFRNDSDPTQGVIWYFIMLPFDTTPSYKCLSDRPVDPDDIVYGQGATLDRDYSPVVRRVVVAGDAHGERPAGAVFDATGTTPASNVFRPSPGWVRKIAGDDGVYDTTAVDRARHYSDFDLSFQIQETYLAHDPFRGDDEHPLSVTSMYTTRDPGFPPGRWVPVYLDTIEENHNTMARLQQTATPFALANTAISLINARAATCIERATVGHCVDGAMILARAEIDADRVLQSAIVLRAESGDWTLREFSAGSFGGVLASGHATAENTQIKINCKYNQIQVYFNDVIDDAYTQEDYEFNNHETYFGIGQWDFGTGISDRTTFTDFNVTEFWGDKGIGIGDLDTGDEWFWLGYGYVFNTNGTYTLVQGGTVKDTLGVGDFGTGTSYTYAALDAYQAAHGGALPADVPWLWEDVELAHDTLALGFTYDDAYQLTTVLYDDDEGNIFRKVQWWKSSGGAAPPILLREELGINSAIIRYIPGGPMVSWYNQVALKELGGTFTNVSSTTNYSNTFLPPASLGLMPLQGEYPAQGVIRDERLRSYIQREKIAYAVFRELGDPKINFACDVYPPITMAGGVPQVYAPYQRGELVTVRCRRAGWDNVGVDTRPVLRVRSIQRMANVGPKAHYRLTLGDAQMDITDPARSHLLKAGQARAIPYNLGLPSLVGMSYYFADPIETDQFFGDSLEVKVNAIGEQANGDMPLLTFPATTRQIQLPVGTFPPGTAFESQHRTVSKSGETSDWSPKYTGVTPAAPSYERPYLVNFPIGNGVDVIAASVDGTEALEIPLPEGGRIISWEVNMNGPSALQFDVQWIDPDDRAALGLAGYASLSSAGQGPYTTLIKYSGLSNHGSDLRYWDAKAQSLNAHDKLRLLVAVVNPGTTATQGTVSLYLERRGVETEHPE